MSSVTIDVEDDLLAILRQSHQAVSAAVRELMVFELYREGIISSGKAAEWLHMERWDFVQHASRRGIPYFDMTADEWAEEATRSASL
jgi:predicted HTH domain antitoxin